MPLLTTKPRPRTTATPAITNPRRDSLLVVVGVSCGMDGSVGGRRFILGVPASPMDDAEHHGNEDQRSDGSKNQAANDGTPERRVLLAALAQPERHRRHSDDHGKGGHQHRAEA